MTDRTRQAESAKLTETAPDFEAWSRDVDCARSAWCDCPRLDGSKRNTASKPVRYCADVVDLLQTAYAAGRRAQAEADARWIGHRLTIGWEGEFRRERDLETISESEKCRAGIAADGGNDGKQ